MNQAQQKNDALMIFMMYIKWMTEERAIGSRKTISLYQDQDDRIGDLRAKEKIWSESEAVRRLIDLALAQIEKGATLRKRKEKK